MPCFCSVAAFILMNIGIGVSMMLHAVKISNRAGLRSPSCDVPWTDCEDDKDLPVVALGDMGPFHIVYSTDTNDWDLLAASIQSLIRHFSMPDKAIVTLMVPEEEHTLVNAVVDELRACLIHEFGARGSALTVRVHPVSNISLAHLQSLTSLDGWPTAALYRLLLPELLPNRHRVLYLDTDVIVNGDLVPLLQVKMNHAVGVVPSSDDLYWNLLSNTWLGIVGAEACPDYANLTSQGFRINSETYFNSGVMLLDLDRWRAENLTRLVTEIGESDLVHWCFADQLALNLAFGDGSVDVLDWRWNAASLNSEFCPNMPKKCHDQVRIAHLNGGAKCTDENFVCRDNGEFWQPAPRKCIAKWLDK
mmetsp:Transcript_37192/g.81200  ORF Transcript_37192/g.81200 Transcript_37192/m.81200 type:complete len:362 (+) Transcript_37192:51-1136(+)